MNTKETVMELLTNKPHLRDSDNKLICTYWWRELKAKNLHPRKMNGEEFMHLFAHLRGRLYVDRKGKLQDKWKKDLGYE
jgi:hypothetical protein